MNAARRLSARPVALAAALVLQILLLMVVVYPRLSPRLFGVEHRLAARPVDPIDPFRGAYVAIAYDGLEPAAFGNATGDGQVFFPLERSGSISRPGATSSTRPVSGPYLTCKSSGGVPECGIESLFLPQAEARETEQRLAEDGAVARVKIDRSGRAALIGLEPR